MIDHSMDDYGFYPWGRLFTESFQRPVDENRVRRYVREYDRRFVNPPVVALLPDGRGSVMDGQHTIATVQLAEPNTTGIVCRIVRDLDAAERAGFFLAMNSRRKPVAPMDRVVAGRLAGIPSATAVGEALDESPYPPDTILAISRLEGLAKSPAYRAYGSGRVVQNTLATLFYAYGQEGREYFYDLYIPIADVLTRYGTAPDALGGWLRHEFPRAYLFKLALMNHLNNYPGIKRQAKKELTTTFLAERMGLIRVPGEAMAAD